jgi:chloramphenicol 3-O-phosphotransferase
LTIKIQTKVTFAFTKNKNYKREHDFNNDSRLDGLEILSAIKHSDLAHDFQVDMSKMTQDEIEKATEKEINHYTGK